jgi:uncharacterized protein (TIGR00299 family) protein
MSRHLHIDAFAGISGDMFLGACVDLGVSIADIEAALQPLQLSQPWQLIAEPTHRHGIRGTNLHVAISDAPRHAPHPHALDHPHPLISIHPHTPHPPQSPLAHPHAHAHSHDHGSTYRQIMAMIDRLTLSPAGRRLAQTIVTKLGEAEASVHGISIDAVHFHEVGAIDSIVDMLGSALALDMLGVQTFSCSPLPIGSGFVKCAHGLMPLPAPATAHLLKGMPHFGVPWMSETVTPTGAAILAALNPQFGTMPAMAVDAIGYGAGDRDPQEVPNLLRLFIGQRIS